MLLMIRKWWGGWVWMVVMLGFGFVHGGERYIILLCKNIILMCCIVK